MVLILKYYLLNVSKSNVLYPFYVLAWVLSEMLALPLIEEIDERVQENSIENDIKKRKSQRQHRGQKLVIHYKASGYNMFTHFISILHL